MMKVRESGIEILRILCAIGIVWGHFNGQYALSDNSIISFLYNNIINSVTVSCVDVFIIISGFFLCDHNNRALGKPVSLLFQLIIVNVIFYFFYILWGGEFSLIDLLVKFIPINYFIILYCTLYLISPYLRPIYDSLTIANFKLMIILLLLLFSIEPMLDGILTHFNGGKPIPGFNTVGLYGNQAGYTIVNFLVLYLIGAYCKKSDVKDNYTKCRLLFLILCFLVVISIMGIIPINSYPWHISRFYDNIFVIGIAFCLFVLFQKIKISSNFINFIAKGAFACYIIHIQVLPFLSIIDNVTLSIKSNLLVMILFSIAMILIGVGFNYVYELFFSPFIKKIIKYNLRAY